VHTQAVRRALCRPTVHRLLARPVLAQRLPHEHRQNLRGRKKPLAMRWKQRVGHLQKLRTGEQIEKVHRLGLLGIADDRLGMLLRRKLGITIPQGWPSRLLVMLLGNNILPISAASLLLKFQSVTAPTRSRYGLSQCHSA